jgi:hypothetical protein
MLVYIDYTEQVKSGDRDRDLIWKYTSNYRQQKELFTDGSQDVGKGTNYILEVFEIFFYK